MKVIILAAGQGTRLRPLTNEKPKCMVEANKKSLIMRQLSSIKACNIKEEDIYIICGYRDEVLKDFLKDTKINFVKNEEYESTNMVFSLMCAREVFEKNDDVVVSYGDIIYTKEVFSKLITSEDDISVISDKGWYNYWKLRCDNPLDDAETFIMDKDNYILELGQKTNDINKVHSQYIGLMRFKGEGIKKLLKVCDKAQELSNDGKSLWRTDRTYRKMYMTDLLQGIIDEGNKVKSVIINRGWFEVDCVDDLKIVEKSMMQKGKVYWLTGLSGAGKTTIGKELFVNLKSKKDNVIFLDGDELREVFDCKEYDFDSRKNIAYKYSRLCQMLSNQGMDVVICTISMFNDVRAWNRNNIENYVEVYIKVDKDVLIKRNQKNLYSSVLDNKINSVMGMDIKFEEPISPDLIINNNNLEPVNKAVSKILEC